MRLKEGREEGIGSGEETTNETLMRTLRETRENATRGVGPSIPVVLFTRFHSFPRHRLPSRYLLPLLFFFFA